VAKKANPFTENIIKALMSTGYSFNTAKMIAYGQQKMDVLSRAIKMSHAPYYISIDIWDQLYKKN